MSRLLVVEDDPDIALALRLLLTRAGHQVAQAKDGRSGLRDAYTDRPELVILDIGLPGMDGWQVLERRRDALEGAVTEIGRVEADEGLRCVDANGVAREMCNGYRHF